jgi:hypothetical protein
MGVISTSSAAITVKPWCLVMLQRRKVHAFLLWPVLVGVDGSEGLRPNLATGCQLDAGGV